MSIRLMELLWDQTPGRIGVAQDMQGLARLWDMLSLSEDDQKVWNIISDARTVPMLVELVSVSELRGFTPQRLSEIRIKYES